MGGVTNHLILGGTGKTGGRITRLLREAGLPVRAASRHHGVDLDDPTTWPAALAGVTAAYVMAPDLRPDQHRITQFTAAAVRAGVRRLVLLSAPGADDEHHPLHAVEQAVRTSGVDWTILRPGWFAQNFSEDFWRPGVLSGALALPTGTGRTPFIDADDIAAVAVAALTEDGHRGQVYELMGPRALSFGEAVALIGQAAGRSIEHVDIDPDEFIERQVAQGVPPFAARMLTGIYQGIRDGRADALADGVQRALGRPPRRFEDFVADAARAGCWKVDESRGLIR